MTSFKYTYKLKKKCQYNLSRDFSFKCKACSEVGLFTNRTLVDLSLFDFGSVLLKGSNVKYRVEPDIWQQLRNLHIGQISNLRWLFCSCDHCQFYAFLTGKLKSMNQTIKKV